MKAISLIALLLLSLSASLNAQQVRWSTLLDSVGAFSSPRAADLNQDGILDIVVGGGIENAPSPSGVIALDGQNGQILWNLPTRNHLFGTPLLRDLTGDSIPEVFITGREAQFYCLNGQNGAVLWEFWSDAQGNPTLNGWYQFYSPQWVPDQNGDQIPDLVVTNGGDATALANDSLRPAGHLMILSAVNGQILAQDTMPDGRETYHSPLVQFNGTSPVLLFGSGGETVRGKYWQVSLDDFMQSGLANAQVLSSDTAKGFIAVPSLADLSGDGILDPIVPALNGALLALDGNSHQEIWRVQFPGTENYVSPVLGQFTGDATPDAFAIFAQGVWPFYSFFVQVLIDGATGQIVWQDTTSTYQLASGNALDQDGDGWDELLLIRNIDAGFYQVNYQNQFFFYDFNDSTFTSFSGPRSGLNVFTSPLIEDLDGDGLLDLIYTYHPQVDNWYNFDGFRMERMDLNLSVRPVAWGGYLGTGRDGVYQPPVMSARWESTGNPPVFLYPNPGYDRIHLAPDLPVDQFSLLDIRGKVVWEARSPSFPVEVIGLPPGLYLYRMQCGQQVYTGKWIRREK